MLTGGILDMKIMSRAQDKHSDMPISKKKVFCDAKGSNANM